MVDRRRLRALLDEIETEMQQQGLWQSVPPDPTAFDSTQPFFYDTMNFSEWLQWAFLTRFRAILAGEHPLPDRCLVAPMAEEYFKGLEDMPARHLIALLRQFDGEINENPSASSLR